MHEHCCEHELAYCKVCDIVYCKKCGKEWGKKEYWYYSNPTPPLVTWSGTASTYHTHEEG
jgi:hypothetical protein